MRCFAKEKSASSSREIEENKNLGIEAKKRLFNLITNKTIDSNDKKLIKQEKEIDRVNELVSSRERYHMGNKLKYTIKLFNQIKIHPSTFFII